MPSGFSKSSKPTFALFTADKPVLANKRRIGIEGSNIEILLFDSCNPWQNLAFDKFEHSTAAG